jgi:hypothetical protein
MLLPELVEALDGPVGDKGVLDNAAQIEVDEGHGSQVVTGEPRVDDDLIAVAHLLGHLLRRDDLDLAQLMQPSRKQDVRGTKITYHTGLEVPHPHSHGPWSKPRLLPPAQHCH